MLHCDTKFLTGIWLVFDWKNIPISTSIACKIPNNAALKHIMRIRTGGAFRRNRTGRERTVEHTVENKERE